MNRIDLAGRVAIITGGARGIGRAIAERIAGKEGNPDTSAYSATKPAQGRPSGRRGPGYSG